MVGLPLDSCLAALVCVGTLALLTTVVVAADDVDCVSAAGDDDDIDNMAQAPYDDEEMVEEFEGLCMLKLVELLCERSR